MAQRRAPEQLKRIVRKPLRRYSIVQVPCASSGLDKIYEQHRDMKNTNLLHILLLSAFILVVSTALCHGAGGKKKLLLFAKNPSTWSIVKNGANGKLVYHEATGAFSLAAAGLKPRSPYALIRIDEAAQKAEILARGVSNQQGKLELSGNWRNWTKKFWVVSGEDITGKAGENGTLKAWRPDRYLFEEKALGIPCDCPEPEEPS